MEAPRKFLLGGLLLVTAWMLDQSYSGIPRPEPVVDVAVLIDHDAFLPLLSVGATALAYIHGGRREACILASGLLLTAGVTVALKAGVDAPRPYLLYDYGGHIPEDGNPLYRYGTASFPSMHAAVALAVYAGLRRGLDGRSTRLLFILAVTVALSRPAIYRHLFLDVAVGGEIGYLSVEGVRQFWNRGTRGIAPERKEKEG